MIPVAVPSAAMPSRSPVRVSPSSVRVSSSIRAAPPAAKGDAPDVPPPTVSADSSTLLWRAAHEEHESDTTCHCS